MKKPALKEKPPGTPPDAKEEATLPEVFRARLETLTRPVSEANGGALKACTEMLGLLKRVTTSGGLPEDREGQRRASEEALAKVKEGGLLSALGQLSDARETTSRAVEDSLPEILKALSESTGVSVQGAVPDIFLDSLIAFTVDTKKHVFLVEDVRFPTTDVILALEHALQQLRLLNRESFDSAATLSEIRQAYLDVTRANGLSDGDRAPMNAVLYTTALRRQKEAFKSDPSARHFSPYSRAAFRRDLNRLLRGGPPPSIEGKRLQLEPGSFSKEGLYMYVPDLHRCAFVSRIRFS